MLTMTKYSQGEEQEHILSALAGVQSGRFLDIGSFNPTTFSNVRALYESGWSGVMVEPSPEPFLSLLKEYGNDERVTLICAALGFERGLTKMYATADATSTTDQEHFDKWKSICKFDGSFWVPRVTLADILNQFGAFDFVSIDAEGISASLFLALMQTAMRPQCICVEHDTREVELLSVAGPRGYRLVYRNGENLVLSL